MIINTLYIYIVFIIKKVILLTLNKVLNNSMNNDLNLLLTAISDYDAYPLKQRELLKVLVDISINNTAVTAPVKLARILSTTRATVYLSLRRLKEDNVIINNKGKNEKNNTFKLNQNKLDEIMLIYKKKLIILKNNL